MTRKNEYLELLKPFLGNKMEVSGHSYIIKNDVCGEILVNYWDKSGFNFFCHNIRKLPYIDYQDEKTLSDDFPKQNKIFKPTQEKVYFEISRIEKMYLRAIKISKQRINNIGQFLSKVESLGGEHHKPNNTELDKTGWVHFDHYELQYTIYSNGHIYQKIRLRYQGEAIDFLLTQKYNSHE